MTIMGGGRRGERDRVAYFHGQAGAVGHGTIGAQARRHCLPSDGDRHMHHGECMDGRAAARPLARLAALLRRCIVLVCGWCAAARTSAPRSASLSSPPCARRWTRARHCYQRLPCGSPPRGRSTCCTSRRCCPNLIGNAPLFKVEAIAVDCHDDTI